MKIAIITGGSNGIGKAAALELGRRGVGVLLTYHSNEGGAREVVRTIELSGARAATLKLELGRPATFDEFARSAALELERVWKRPSITSSTTAALAVACRSRK
jgi:NAD(P)-dependent dehydrogenase (short-subunit alcohol dehydrogenase family)